MYDRVNRKSNTGTCEFYGRCLLHDSSKQQSVVAQSSAEAELYAAASGVSTAVLHYTLLDWLGLDFDHIELYVDSKAAKAIVEKVGVNNVRHLEVKMLWIQDLVQKGLVKIYNVLGTENPADVHTKV